MRDFQVQFATENPGYLEEPGFWENPPLIVQGWTVDQIEVELEGILPKDIQIASIQPVTRGG